MSNFSSVAQSCPTLCDPHESQHARLPCLSLSPRVCSNSCPLSRWCHPTIDSVTLFFSCPQSFLALGSFPVGWLFASGGQSTGVSVSVPLIDIQGWFPLVSTGLISLQSKGLQESSPTPQFKSIYSLAVSLLYGPTLTLVHNYWKNHSFHYVDLCWQSNISAS